MRMATCLVSSALALSALASCGKGSSAHKGSGDLAATEVSLFKELPGGNLALFGGNYMKMQNFMSSTMGKALASQFKDEKSEAWMGCFTNFKDLKIVGGIGYQGTTVTMRIGFSGLKLTEIADCAKKAGYTANVDQDGKFLSVDVQAAGMTINQGYLQLASGGLYSRMVITFGLPPSFASGNRADLEGDIAGAATKNASQDTALTALAAKVDRNRTFWFAGTAAGTPIANKIGEIYGSVDLDGGLAMDVTVQVTSGSDADKIADGVKDMKKMSDKMPGELKSVIDDLDFSRDGDHLRFAAKLNDKQLTSLMSLSGGMGMGMGRRKHSME